MTNVIVPMPLACFLSPKLASLPFILPLNIHLPYRSPKYPLRLFSSHAIYFWHLEIALTNFLLHMMIPVLILISYKVKYKNKEISICTTTMTHRHTQSFPNFLISRSVFNLFSILSLFIGYLTHGSEYFSVHQLCIYVDNA